MQSFALSNPVRNARAAHNMHERAHARRARARTHTHTHTHTQRAWFAGVTNDDMTDVAANKHYITIFMTM